MRSMCYICGYGQVVGYLKGVPICEGCSCEHFPGVLLKADREEDPFIKHHRGNKKDTIPFDEKAFDLDGIDLQLDPAEWDPQKTPTMWPPRSP